MMENCAKQLVRNCRTLAFVCGTTAVLGGCLLNSEPVPVVYGEGASYSPYSMPDLHNGERVVTVQPGDTLSRLAVQYHLDFRQFAARNDLRDPYVIYPGQRLVVPRWEQDNPGSGGNTAIAGNSTTSSRVGTKSVSIGGYQQIVEVPLDQPTAGSNAIQTADAGTGAGDGIDEPRPIDAMPRIAPTNGGSIPTPGIKPQEFAARAERRYASANSWDTDSAASAIAIGSASPSANAPIIAASAGAETPTPAPAPAVKEPATIAKTAPLVEPDGRKGFVWPVQGKILLRYGAGTGGLYNDGINIQAERGTPIVAADNGVVTYVGNELRGFGNLILIKHADDYVTAYAHTENPMVARGDVVTRGQKISTVGSTGAVTKPQLHFEIRKGRKSTDPTKVLPQTMVAR